MLLAGYANPVPSSETNNGYICRDLNGWEDNVIAQLQKKEFQSSFFLKHKREVKVTHKDHRGHSVGGLFPPPPSSLQSVSADVICQLIMYGSSITRRKRGQKQHGRWTTVNSSPANSLTPCGRVILSRIPTIGRSRHFSTFQRHKEKTEVCDPSAEQVQKRRRTGYLCIVYE